MPGSGHLAARFDASYEISPVYVAVSTFVQGSLPEVVKGKPGGHQEVGESAMAWSLQRPSR
ncbi:MAG: hypothetical protein OEV20_10965 [Actinomycetota bacterium]|nr:hypothetical protein [Actinomycetota bacterium]